MTAASTLPVTASDADTASDSNLDTAIANLDTAIADTAGDTYGDIPVTAASTLPVT